MTVLTKSILALMSINIGSLARSNAGYALWAAAPGRKQLAPLPLMKPTLLVLLLTHSKET